MKEHIAAFLALASIFSITGCNESKEPSVVAAAPAPERPTAAPVVEKRDEMLASGPIVVENQIEVAAFREGMIATILVEPGTMVRKGQLLAKLDDRQISAD